MVTQSSCRTGIFAPAITSSDRYAPRSREEANVDGILGPSVYIDLHGKSDTVALSALLDGVKQGRAKPTKAPSFPTHFEPSQEPRFPGKLPGIWNVRRERNPHLTGRDELRRQLRERLDASAAPLPPPTAPLSAAPASEILSFRPVSIAAYSVRG